MYLFINLSNFLLRSIFYNCFSYNFPFIFISITLQEKSDEKKICLLEEKTPGSMNAINETYNCVYNILQRFNFFLIFFSHKWSGLGLLVIKIFYTRYLPGCLQLKA